MSREGGKTINQRFFIGANTDDVSELAATKDGVYYDAQNMRPSGITGNANAIEKIKGEVQRYGVLKDCSGTRTITSDYVCIGACSVKGYNVCFWTSDSGNVDPITGLKLPVANHYPAITIDGTIALMSPDFKLDVNYPLQLDTNESCVGGEVFITDFHVLPYIFNIKDLVDNISIKDTNGNFISCGTKYFDDFDPALYTTQLNMVLDHPIFLSLNSNTPLSVGSYSYAIRYVDSTGNRTGWSAHTPLIPMPKSNKKNTNTYYDINTYGGFTSEDGVGGITIRFRVTNLLNYDYIEIKRLAHIVGAPFGSMPSEGIYKLTDDIKTNPYTIIDFEDDGDVVWTTPSESDVLYETNSIACAKSIRYYDNKLILGNIKTASKDIEDAVSSSFINVSGDYGFNSIKALGKSGYKLIDNQVNYKSYMRGEKYSFGVLCYDESGGRTFAIPYTGMVDVRMKNRRDIVSGQALIYSDSTPKAAVNGAGNATGYDTYEVFSLDDATEKTNDLSDDKVINIRHNYCVTDIEPVTDLRVLQPTGHDEDLSSGNDLSFNPTTKVNVAASSSAIDYSPKGFEPNYFAMGVGFNGIDMSVLPDWVKGFSIVRRERVNQVVAQGLGMYCINPMEVEEFPGDVKQGLSKELNSFWAWFPDVDAGFTEGTFDQYTNGNYQIELVSPLGFFSEIYSFESRGGNVNITNDIEQELFNAKDTQIDMAVYARILRENGTINSGLNGYASGSNSLYSQDYWTNFDCWRNGGASGGMTNTKFDIIGFDEETMSTEYGSLSGRGTKRYKVKVANNGRNVYNNDWVGGSTFRSIIKNANHDHVMQWHEPFYIINIVKKAEASSPISNIDTYYDLGHLQKKSSIIHVVGGEEVSSISVPLVDERPEDCICSSRDIYFNRYCYVDGKRWIDISLLSPSNQSIIINGIQNSNGLGYETSDSYRDSSGNLVSTTKKVYGVYQASGGTLYFTWTDQDFDKSIFVPLPNSVITVEYDNRIPIVIFGGDTTIGESVFCPIDVDKGQAKGGDAKDRGFFMGGCFPYYKFELNDNILIMNDAHNCNLQDNNKGNLDIVRQMIVMFTCESRANIPLLCGTSKDGSGNVVYSLDQCFPNIHYIYRPLSWKPSEDENFDVSGGSGNVHEDYKTTYPSEWEKWGFGGFRFKQLYNIDYSKDLNSKSSVSKPKVGWKEQTDFCSRIIWSATRPINVQDTPNLKNFPASNVYDIEDAQGAIKYLWDSNSDGGNNIYALTNNGVCLLLTNKQMLTEGTGATLAMVGGGVNYFSSQIWLSKIYGVNDEMWRSISEWDKSLFFANDNSVFFLFNNELKDIRNDYYVMLRPALKNVLSGYGSHVTSAYNKQNREYWLAVEDAFTILDFTDVLDMTGLNQGDHAYIPDVDGKYELNPSGLSPNIYLPSGFDEGDSIYLYNSCPYAIGLYGDSFGNEIQAQYITSGSIRKYTKDDSTFGWSFVLYEKKNQSYIYNLEREKWTGKFDYYKDRFITNGTKIFSAKEGMVYEQGVGWMIDGNPVEASVIQVAHPDTIAGKEFISTKIASIQKPTSVEFARKVDSLPEALLSENMSSPTNPYYLKNYNGWTNFIPRMLQGNRDRLQDRKMYYKIVHNDKGEFVLVSVDTEYKILSMY